jgi:hypothetical protein
MSEKIIDMEKLKQLQQVFIQLNNTYSHSAVREGHRITAELIETIEHPPYSDRNYLKRVSREQFEQMTKEELVELCYTANDYLDYMTKINVYNMQTDKWVEEKHLPETFWQKFITDLEEYKTPENFIRVVFVYFKNKMREK